MPLNSVRAATLRTTPRDASAPRLDSVDLLRGIIMVVMALDHVRDFLTVERFDPANLSQTTAPLFWTRWVTHFCAPNFMFLAGVGAGVAMARGKSPRAMSVFLLTRGLWLILLEQTVVHVGWFFNFSYPMGVELLVLWSLGVSMICLAGLLHLPRPVLLAFCIAMIAGHNTFDSLSPDRFGSLAPLWSILHVAGPARIGSTNMFVLYPIIPWVAVMAAGFLLAPILLDPINRRGRLFLLGLALTTAFVLLRALNRYGDPVPWSLQKNTLWTIMSFLNTNKYPPSLGYLLMTIGPALVALAAFDNASGWFARVMIIFGRVPMFFYLLHIYLCHAVMVLVGMAQGFSAKNMCISFMEMPTGFGCGLPAIYAAWIGIIVALYLPCRWFAQYKRTHRQPWLSYL